MLVAGDHAHNDMAGEESDSLASLIKAAGIEVEAKLKGLGDDDAWADIYVERLRAQVQAYEKAKPK
jgi:sirohydrochlorin cobaltochelatase